jgi:glycosyltransferase involved in cell wall biosynthesis
MATVSILIPAYKPDYLRKAIASAQEQSIADIEILVGDDTTEGVLRDIVEGIDDPRVQYFHHGFRDGRANSRRLWERASGQYVKWLYDDDLLMPQSVEVLIGALGQHPESVMAFHERVFIDGGDNIVHVPPSLIATGETALIDRKFLVQNMIAGANNFIGEPSNVMMVRDRVDFSSLMAYRAWNVTFLNDVAMYMNLAAQAPLVLVGGYMSCFRKHAAQTSSGSSPIIAAGYYEWEVMVRGEASAGQFSVDGLVKAAGHLKKVYGHGIETLGIAELVPLLNNLQELTAQPTADLFDSPQFRADVANVGTMMGRRLAAV